MELSVEQLCTELNRGASVQVQPVDPLTEQFAIPTFTAKRYHMMTRGGDQDLPALYSPMGPVWNKLWNLVVETTDEKKVQWARFWQWRFQIESEYSSSPEIYALRGLSWQWTHHNNPLESSTIILSFGAWKHWAINMMMVGAWDDSLSLEWMRKGSVDELSSEVEWRRGLHSARKDLVLCSCD